jgi:RNA polymerase sigma-70 factor (ECF subfamily)
MSPERSLWEQAAAGNADAFATFYERHADRVFAHCVYRSGSRADAEDVTAEVFALAWRERVKVRFSAEADILPWLLTTATNLILEQQRKAARGRRAARRVTVEDEPDIAAAIADQDELQRDQQRALRVLGELSPADREVIELCVVNGLAPSAVAVGLNAPASTIRNRLSRALGRARAAYRSLDDGAGVDS